MGKHKDPLLDALAEGKSYTWTVPDGGDLASMRKAIKHGQTLTMSPIIDPGEIATGDMVLVKWHGGDIFHIVGEIKDDQYLIVNSLGKENGWVNAQEILGRITKIIEPESHGDVPGMIEQLERSFQQLIEKEKASTEDVLRFSSITDDLRWYAKRLPENQWSVLPKANKWSFEQNLWHLTKQAKTPSPQTADQVKWIIDQGKVCIGLAAEIVSLLEVREEIERSEP